MSRKSFSFGMAALAMGVLLSAARLAGAHTISVQSLNFDGGSPSIYTWHYNTSLSTSGEIKTGDYVEVDTIPGFLSTSADDTTVTGALGTMWNVTYNLSMQEVEAVYTGNKGTIKNTTSGIANLVNLSFLDSSNVDGGTATWGSDDHAAVGSHAGQAEAPVTGQIVDAPVLAAPTPAPAIGGAALLGLLLIGKVKKAFLA